MGKPSVCHTEQCGGGGEITGAGGRNGDIKEIEGGAGACGFEGEGRGVNACEFGEAREGLRGVGEGRQQGAVNSIQVIYKSAEEAEGESDVKGNTGRRGEPIADGPKDGDGASGSVEGDLGGRRGMHSSKRSSRRSSRTLPSGCGRCRRSCGRLRLWKRSAPPCRRCR